MTSSSPGSIFAGHRIEGVIGRGGMGIVYRARQLTPDRLVALKIVAPELAGDPAIRARFLAETELLAAVEHPHVVPIHAAGESDGRLYLTMRLLEGRSLHRLVAAEGRLGPSGHWSCSTRSPRPSMPSMGRGWSTAT